MRKIKIAFDVDGTLRCNCTDTCEDPNWDVVRLFNLLEKMKNTEMYVWSGGGKAYAERFTVKYGVKVPFKNIYSKFDAPQMDICVDDIQETNLATINLIVREK